MLDSSLSQKKEEREGEGGGEEEETEDCWSLFFRTNSYRCGFIKQDIDQVY